jgi:hypothetical protein
VARPLLPPRAAVAARAKAVAGGAMLVGRHGGSFAVWRLHVLGVLTVVAAIQCGRRRVTHTWAQIELRRADSDPTQGHDRPWRRLRADILMWPGRVALWLPCAGGRVPGPLCLPASVPDPRRW